MRVETYKALPAVVLTEAQLLMIRGGDGTGTIIQTKTDTECTNMICNKCQNCECTYSLKCGDCGVDVKIISCGDKSLKACGSAKALNMCQA